MVTSILPVLHNSQQQHGFHPNPLKTECVSFIKGLSEYRAVNTLNFGYKNQSLNVL
jgi:hypothetical protein